MAERRYFWLKISQNFYDQREVKRLIARHDERTLVLYQYLMIRSLDCDGSIYLDTFDDESVEYQISIELSDLRCTEEEARHLLDYLETHHLIEYRSPEEIFLPMVPTITGTETDAAVRKRRMRARKKAEQEAQLNKQLEEIPDE